MLEDPQLIAVVDHNAYDAIGSLCSGNVSITTQGILLRTIDAGPGTSKRTGAFLSGNPVKMTISHSETKENAPLVTARSLIRLDQTRYDVGGKAVVLSAYLVVAHPQGGLFTNADALQLLRTLLAYALVGQWSQGVKLLHDPQNAPLGRIVSGEP